MSNFGQLKKSIQDLIEDVKAAKAECRNGFFMAALMEMERHLFESIQSFDACDFATIEYGPELVAIREKREAKVYHLLK